MIGENMEWLDSKTCPECGKQFDVLYPNLWRYKVAIATNRYKYFCSWRCLRADEQRKDTNKMRKLTEDQKKMAIEIALAGTSPIKYLEIDCGIANGSQCWTNIKKRMKESDPETWEKLNAQPSKRVRKQQKAEPATVKMSGPIRIVTDEPENVEVEKPKPDPAKVTAMAIIDRVDAMHMGEARTYEPVEIMGYPIRAVEKKPLGLFFYDSKHNRLDWTTPEGDEISMRPSRWWDFAEMIPEVFAILGVDPHEESNT